MSLRVLSPVRSQASVYEVWLLFFDHLIFGQMITNKTIGLR